MKIKRYLKLNLKQFLSRPQMILHIVECSPCSMNYAAEGHFPFFSNDAVLEKVHYLLIMDMSFSLLCGNLTYHNIVVSVQTRRMKLQLNLLLTFPEGHC